MIISTLTNENAYRISGYSNETNFALIFLQHRDVTIAKNTTINRTINKYRCIDAYMRHSASII